MCGLLDLYYIDIIIYLYAKHRLQQKSDRNTIIYLSITVIYWCAGLFEIVILILSFNAISLDLEAGKNTTTPSECGKAVKNEKKFTSSISNWTFRPLVKQRMNVKHKNCQQTELKHN